ncbi:hypothetical protein [Rhodospirillaceae bacterium SYSU D60014]|uniref:hypothetical protein n=1 Tax=Virgifigura deserti TaxID=2268457 RepID=UPI000E671A04
MLLPALLGLACAGSALADTADFRNGLAPYRFNPPPETLSPAEEGAAQAYQSRLESRLNRLERQQFGADALEREQLRDTRRELGRVERLLNQR